MDDRINYILKKYPRLDYLMAQTVCSLTEEELEEIINAESESIPEPESYVLQSVTVE